jgi:hypothetical protein
MIGSCAAWNVVWYGRVGRTGGSGGSRESLGSLLPLLPPVTRRRHTIALQSRTSNQRLPVVYQISAVVSLDSVQVL